MTCCILQHFLAKLDDRKSDDSNRWGRQPPPPRDVCKNEDSIRGAMIQEKGAIEYKKNRGGGGRVGGGDSRHTYILDYIKCRILQHFLAKLDVRKK